MSISVYYCYSIHHFTHRLHMKVGTSYIPTLQHTVRIRKTFSFENTKIIILNKNYWFILKDIFILNKQT